MGVECKGTFFGEKLKLNVLDGGFIHTSTLSP